MPDIIAIEVNERFIDLQDETIRLEIVNSFFTTEFYQGDYSFPFEVPATPENMITFGFANLIETSNRPREMTAIVYVFGLPKYNCKLTIKKGKRRSFSIVLNTGIKTLVNANKKLAEIDLGADLNMGNSQEEILAKIKVVSELDDWSVYGMAFPPFYHDDFYGGNNPDFCGIMNRQDPTTGEYLGNPQTGAADNKNGNVPWLYLFYILNRIFQAENLTPSGTLWTHKEMRQLLVTNNRALDMRPRDFNTVVKLPEHVDFVSNAQRLELSTLLDGYDNAEAWDDIASEYVIKRAGLHIVSIRIQTAGEDGGGKFDVVYDGSVIATIVLDKDYGTAYFKTFQINASAGDIGNVMFLEYYLTGSDGIQVLKGNTHLTVTLDATTLPARQNTFIKYKNHVPDWTVAEFLSEVKKLGVNFEFDFAKAKVTIDLIPDILTASGEIDLRGKPDPDYELILEDAGKGTTLGYEFPGDDTEPEMVVDPDHYIGEFMEVDELPGPNVEGDVALITNMNQFRQVQKVGAVHNQWVFIGHNYAPYKIGNGEQQLKCKLAPVMMGEASNLGGTAEENRAIMPWLKGAGSSELYGTGINPFQPRLAFWRGINQFGHREWPPLGGFYLFASSQNYGINRNKVGELTFRMDQEIGIMRTNNERLLNAVNSSEVAEKNLYLDPETFERIKGSSKVVTDFNLFLIKSISVGLSKTVAKARAVLLKL